ncbi:hypothetical protein [Thermus amyloliquefaciens]|uniref:hypothetical protein n=1 Tax=Thermus amyloliquefaciens TaxID=1449080 RepID=UPI00056F4457|nr:hypothetical protein [Thermus amyloliquefaciens]
MNGYGRLFLALALLLASALGARFAAFSVEPFGPQRVNLDTGVTTLPQGGILTDNEQAWKLKGSFVEYKENSFIFVKRAEFLTDAFRLDAQELRLDIPRQTVSISGLSLHHPLFSRLWVKKGLLFLEEDILVAREEVRVEKPLLEASLMVVNLKTKQGLVLGEFTFSDGRGTLRGKGKEARLYLYLAGNNVRGSTRLPPHATVLEAWIRRAP